MEGTALVLMLSELIGLKIIFDVDLRDVGKTPRRDMDILSTHYKGEANMIACLPCPLIIED